MPVVVATEYFPFVLLDMGGAERTDEDLRRMFAELRHKHSDGRVKRGQNPRISGSRPSPRPAPPVE